MFGIGMPEMLLILAIALIVIGPKKLPDLAKTIGRAMGEFKKATNEIKQSMEVDTSLKDVKEAFSEINQDIKESVSFDTIEAYPSPKKPPTGPETESAAEKTKPPARDKEQSMGTLKNASNDLKTGSDDASLSKSAPFAPNDRDADKKDEE